MKRCERYEDSIARFMHGEILLPEREELERHLSLCARCAKLYLEITEVDRVLRELSANAVEPPAYLRQKILANLPDAEKAGKAGESIAWGFGRWAGLAGGLAACALAALIVLRGAPPRELRVASAPPAGPPAASVPRTETPPPAEQARPSPSPRAVAGIPSGPRVAAASPKVQVIKEVKIFFYYPPAQRVAVTGDFNGWDPEGVPLKAAGKPGLWTTNLRLKPGAYSYNFIVDGETLVPDPNAPTQAPDGYGGTNSIMLVKGG